MMTILGPHLTAEINPSTNNERYRCVECGKVAFSTERAVRLARTKIYKDRNTRMRFYRGDCGWWHLARFRGQQYDSPL